MATLQMLRERLKTPSALVSVRLGVSDQYYRSLETANGLLFTVHRIEVFAPAFGMSPDELACFLTDGVLADMSEAKRYFWKMSLWGRVSAVDTYRCVSSSVGAPTLGQLRRIADKARKISDPVQQARALTDSLRLGWIIIMKGK